MGVGEKYWTNFPCVTLPRDIKLSGVWWRADNVESEAPEILKTLDVTKVFFPPPFPSPLLSKIQNMLSNEKSIGSTGPVCEVCVGCKIWQETLLIGKQPRCSPRLIAAMETKLLCQDVTVGISSLQTSLDDPAIWCSLWQELHKVQALSTVLLAKRTAGCGEEVAYCLEVHVSMQRKPAGRRGCPPCLQAGCRRGPTWTELGPWLAAGIVLRTLLLVLLHLSFGIYLWPAAFTWCAHFSSHLSSLSTPLRSMCVLA